MRGGSTSMRTRGGRGTEASAVPRRRRPQPDQVAAVGRAGHRHGGSTGARRQLLGTGARSTASARAGGRPSSIRRARAGPESRPGSACSTASSTSWWGRRVWTRIRPPPARARPAGRPGPAGRAPARRPGTGAPAARRRCPGRPRRRPAAPGGARLPCRRRPRQEGPRLPALGPVTSTTGRPAAASSSSRSPRSPAAPGRDGRAAHLADDGALGRAAGAVQQALAGQGDAAWQRSQRCSARHERHASRRARPGC